jgi:hypothetical protein
VKAALDADLQNDANNVNDVRIINGVIAYRNSFRQPGFLDWDMRLLKEFKIGERMRVDFSIEGFNLTRSSNKQFNSDGDIPFGNPQAAVNPKTRADLHYQHSVDSYAFARHELFRRRAAGAVRRSLSKDRG